MTKGGVLSSGGLFLGRCLCLAEDFGFDGRDKRVREPRGEDVFEVDVDDEDVLAGGLVTGSKSCPCSLSSEELLVLYQDVGFAGLIELKSFC